MEFPVRCFTCGAVIAHLHEEYKTAVKDEKPEAALDKLHVSRYCCRRMFLSYVDLMQNIVKYGRV